MKKFVIFTIVCTLMGAWTTAQAANYDLWVGGTQVTDANKGDVLGDGKVSYDPATLTLTLSNGASVAGTGSASQAATGYGNGIYSLVNGLTIAVDGTVTVSASTSNTAFNGIYLDGNTTITGNGSLTVTGNPFFISIGICAFSPSLSLFPAAAHRRLVRAGTSPAPPPSA